LLSYQFISLNKKLSYFQNWKLENHKIIYISCLYIFSLFKIIVKINLFEPKDELKTDHNNIKLILVLRYCLKKLLRISNSHFGQIFLVPKFSNGRLREYASVVNIVADPWLGSTVTAKNKPPERIGGPAKITHRPVIFRAAQKVKMR